MGHLWKTKKKPLAWVSTQITFLSFFHVFLPSFLPSCTITLPCCKSTAWWLAHKWSLHFTLSPAPMYGWNIRQFIWRQCLGISFFDVSLFLPLCTISCGMVLERPSLDMDTGPYNISFLFFIAVTRWFPFLLTSSFGRFRKGRAQRRIHNIGPNLPSRLQSLSHRHNADSLCLVCKYFQGDCSDELCSVVPTLYGLSAITDWQQVLILQYLNITLSALITDSSIALYIVLF